MRRGNGPGLHTLLGIVAMVMIVVGCTAAGRPNIGPPTATPVALPTLDPGQVARGRQVYVPVCASCHGPNAEGVPNWQQPDASGNLPAPPHTDTGHTWRHSDRQLGEIIREGSRDPFNQSPELTMPPFRGQLSDEEIRTVIAYFKSLWSPEHRAYQEEQNQRPPAPMSEGGR